MIGYLTLGTNDIDRAAAFYDALLAEFGASRFMEMEKTIVWGVSPGQPMLAATAPHDGKPATVGNGTMVALAADSPEMVQRVHQKAMSLNAADEGGPGPRSEKFYGAYFRDLDGNKLAVYCMI